MNNNRSTGLGLAGVLTGVVVVLKLSGTIDWSWLWVLSPMWINALLALIVYAVFLYYY